jgi:hypothetical protein
MPTLTSPRFLHEMHTGLHDLSQPLTMLQFRLEVGKMLGGREDLQEAVDGSLEDTGRIMDALARIRASLAREEEAADK